MAGGGSQVSCVICEGVFGDWCVLCGGVSPIYEILGVLLYANDTDNIFVVIHGLLVGNR